jgi:outer membrane protein assembly factor BamB
MMARWMWILGVGMACLPAAAQASDWPQFRGPNGSATSAERAVPLNWSADQNVAWKAQLPGYGWSSPIIVGDKVFVTTAFSDKQRKPSGGFGGGGGGRGGFGGPGAGGPGGFRPPQPGQILPAPLQERLNLTGDQKKQLEELQKESDGKLGKLLTEEQQKQLKDTAGGPGRSGFGRRGPGGFGGPPRPGQLLPPALQESLKLTDEQKKQLETLQKEVDSRLGKLLTEEQQKQLKDMASGPGRGGRGGFGGPGGGRGQRVPDAVYRWEVYCLNAADGKVLWKQTAAEGKPASSVSNFNTYATETPVTDGERIYAYFGMTGVFCYDLTGKQLWSAKLGAYRTAMGHGSGSSPVVDDGRLFIQCDNEEKSFLVALDAKTGKELWRVNRTERTGWATPLIWKNKVRTEVICLGSPRARSYDPATGKQLWELGGLGGQIKASPVASPEMLYVGTGGGPAGFGGFGGEEGAGDETPGGRGGRGGRFGGGRPLFAVKAGASGDITLKDGAKSNAGVAWYLPQGGPSTASPLLYEGLLYVLEDRGGLMSCYDAKTGKQLYKERLPGARGFTSSPCVSGGKIFCLDDGGTTHVVQAGAKFKVLGKNTIAEMCWSTPAVAAGSLFLRTVDHLYCIRQSGAER